MEAGEQRCSDEPLFRAFEVHILALRVRRDKGDFREGHPAPQVPPDDMRRQAKPRRDFLAAVRCSAAGAVHRDRGRQPGLAGQHGDRGGVVTRGDGTEEVVRTAPLAPAHVVGQVSECLPEEGPIFDEAAEVAHRSRLAHLPEATPVPLEVTVIGQANGAARARERRPVSQQTFPDRPEVLEVARIERIDGCSSDGEQAGQ